MDTGTDTTAGITGLGRAVPPPLPRVFLPVWLLSRRHIDLLRVCSAACPKI